MARWAAALLALEGSDDVQFGDAPSPANQMNQIVVPPAPALASETYGTELVEMYWASLLRDVAFSDYADQSDRHQAAAELTANADLPRAERQPVVTSRRRLLFRGTYPGDTVGPYGSQFMIMPTFLGSQPHRPAIQFLPCRAGFHDRCADLPASSERHRQRRVVIDPVARYRHFRAGISGTFTRRMCFSRPTSSPRWCSSGNHDAPSIPATLMSLRPSRTASAPLAARISPPRSARRPPRA